MAVATSRTIVLTTIPGKMEISPSLSSHMGLPFTTRVAESLLNTGPRKRKRLSHLSPEERMTRRKLKNRVAAQSARDRKKLQMSELEEAVDILRAENERLQEENEQLLDQTGGLADENAELRQRLGLSPDGVVSGRTQVSQESAEGTGTCHLTADQPIPGVADHLQPDVLYGLIEEVVGNAPGTALPGADKRAAKACSGQKRKAPTVVGPTTKELESLKELIHFDHVYYKTAEEPHLPRAEAKTTKPVPSVLRSCPPIKKVKTVRKTATILKSVLPVVPKQADLPARLPPVHDVTDSAAKLPTVHDVTDSAAQLPPVHDVTDSAAQLPLVHDVTDDVTGSGDDSQNIDLGCGLDLSNADLVVLEKNLEQLMDFEKFLQGGDLFSETDGPQPAAGRDLSEDLPASLQEIINSVPNKDIPDSLNIEDSWKLSLSGESGYGSEMSDSGSPRSDVSAGLEDSLWEESFTELFPSLL